MREAAVSRATSIGSFAADIIAGGGEADVIAVFERSFYLLCRKGIVAIVLDQLGNGPLNICVAPASDGTPPWSGLVQTAMKAAVQATGISLHGRFSVSLDDTKVWLPPPWPYVDTGAVAASCTLVRARAAAVFEAAAGEQGLAPLILAPETKAAKSAIAKAADAQITMLTDALPQARTDRRLPNAALAAATLLVGLGPGLTPSGDDVLGGLLLALTATGDIRLRDHLFNAIVDELGDLTVPVSAMHLTAAAHGLGHEAVHALMIAMVTDRLEPAHIDAVAALGATSGWDAIAGIVLGLEASLRGGP